MYVNLANFLYIGQLQPLHTKKMNKELLLEEFVVCILTYNLVYFTDFCPNPIYRYDLGWIMIVVLTAFILQFIVALLATPLGIIWRKTYRCRERCCRYLSEKLKRNRG